MSGRTGTVCEEALVLLLLAACIGDDPWPGRDTGPDTDADTDVTPVGDRLLDAGHVLVVPGGDGLTLLAHDGSVAWSEPWSALLGCDTCGGEGASADGDGLLLAFTTGEPYQAGGIARLGPDAALDFRLDGFEFPHDATRDPADGAVMVTETLGNVITWVAGDGSSSSAVRVLDGTHPDWDGLTPNGVDRFDVDGRSLLVSSHRGGGAPGGFPNGRITMWDLGAIGAPAFLWGYPAEGALDTPHGCVFREWGGRWWLLYAHTGGATSGGSVGLAVTDDPTVAPEYVADLVPVGALAPLVFLRGVELTDDGTLWLTDSGTGGPGGPGPAGGAVGRVIRAPMPDLAPTGATGGVGSHQVVVDLSGAELFAEGLANPFEGWLWAPTFPL